MTTMKDIAMKAGVSRATVSRVINGHTSVSPEKRKIVMEWVRKLDYQPNKVAQSLVQSQSYLIGVIVPNVSNPFFSDMIETIEIEANRQGYSTIICNTNGNIQKEKNYINILRSRQVDGILIVPINKTASHLNTLRKIDEPVVIVTQNLSGFDYVAVSHERGGAQVAKHFIDLGHTEIGCIGPANEDKFDGLKEELIRNGINFNKYNLIKCSYSGVTSSQRVYDKVSEYLKEYELKATAFFTYNDLAACGAMHAFQDHGLKIPDDVVIAGFDNTFLASEIRPTLTSIAQPMQEMGRLAIEVLLNRIYEEEIEDRVQIILEPSLIVRESTRGIKLK